MIHFSGETVTFTAQRAATLYGRRYKEGEQITIRLTRDWNEMEGFGEGGPWGWGGYTSRFIKTLGNIL